MKSSEIRNTFLDFFKSKGHKVIDSAPIVIKNDPSLMFTNAGMNQFKDVFLGLKTPVDSRITNSQKCLRVSGKHNDLEDVGYDTYHHTMFEMLGNWSFGDYFKKEAIEWAWELLTKIYQLPEDRLYATVFTGDKSDRLDEDIEATQLWENILPSEKILKCSKKDNFWEMGDTGPCGPCSEIHIDIRNDDERKKIPAQDLVNKDHPGVIELWNLVFIEYSRKSDGKLEKLPKKHVDTGMGFDRLTAVLQNKTSNYDTDLFTPLIQFLENKFNHKYGKNTESDIAFRVISDHIRAIAFTIADGQLPSNTGAGYVIRRILRRALRFAYKYFDAQEAFLYEMIPLLSGIMGDTYKELAQQADFIMKVIREEEQSFLKTLVSGSRKFESYTSQNSDQKTISGKFAFELYDTYGFPFDLTQLMAKETGFSIDESAFNKELEIQKNRSRKDAVKEEGDWVILKPESSTLFTAYDSVSEKARIIRYRKIKKKNRELYQLVFDKTPFYPEGGGQVGDTGFLKSPAEKIAIIDTLKEHELIIHITEKLPTDLESEFLIEIDVSKRRLTEANHSATHLLHAALRQILGKHVSQKGSFVNHDHLRFDFAHFSKLTEKEIREIEKLVNKKIRENISLQEEREASLQQALKRGAMALFGEKYDKTVRVITFDEKFSIELCGGTHVKASGNIGLFKIRSESAVAAGVRRIEAVSGPAAEKILFELEDERNKIAELLKANKNIPQAVNQILTENKKLNKQLELLSAQQTTIIKKELMEKSEKISEDLYLISSKVNLNSAEQGKNLVFELKKQNKSGILFLASEIDSKALLWLMIPDVLVKEKNLDAREIIKVLAKEIKGGGGGQPFFATAGGSDVEGIDIVVKKARELILELFENNA